jgi:hypothetical protein
VRWLRIWDGGEVRWWSQPARLVAINVSQLQTRLMCE